MPDGAYRITIWTADASNNRAAVAKVVTVDRRAGRRSTCRAAPTSISPNGDGQSDARRSRLRGRRAGHRDGRILDATGAHGAALDVHASAGRVMDLGRRDSAGRTVADGRYTFRVWGLDRAGNPTHPRPAGPRRPDDPVADLVALVVHPGRGPEGARVVRPPPAGHGHGRDLPGDTLVRADLDGGRSPPARYGWTWNGRTASGALVKPGTYRVVVTRPAGSARRP